MQARRNWENMRYCLLVISAALLLLAFWLCLKPAPAPEREEQQDGLVLWTEPVQHIFFHSLILYPEHLFRRVQDNDLLIKLYKDNFVTHREFERILPQLFERGYVLYCISEVFSRDNDAGAEMRQNEIWLPEGKKPLIISIDDPSYHYGSGFANRIILDENGILATEVITPAGQTIVTYDGDVSLVIDNFVQKNPEFSFRGARGIIATTGYLGFMGYKLDTEDSREKAKAVANKYKENGWLFANHSYYHRRHWFLGDGGCAERITYDTKKWKEVIEPIVGETNLYVAPFGYLLEGAAFEVILANGYDIYFDVVLQQRIFVHERFALMGRVQIDGLGMRFNRTVLDALFFDVDSVKDRHR